MATAPAAHTMLMDLNDECLQEVFTWLTEDDLCAAADVCTRLKRIAEAVYKTSGYKYFAWTNEILPVSQLSYIRNFGAFIEQICTEDLLECSVTNRNKVIDMLAHYCGERMIQLEVHQLEITDDVATKMRPLLHHLRILDVNTYDISECFLRMLPIWAPNLHRLELPFFQKNPRFTVQRPIFPQLEKVSYAGNYIANVNEFLKLNPQLKDISDDKNVGLRDIASHAPNIEKLELHECDDLSTKYLRNLSALKSLVLFGHSQKERTLCKIRANDFANIPLEALHLSEFDFSAHADQLFTGISTLKNLKRLGLGGNKGVKTNHILGIYKNCTEISALSVDTNDGILFSAGNILEMLQNMENLKELSYPSSDAENVLPAYDAEELERTNICFDACKTEVSEHVPLEYLLLHRLDARGCVDHLMVGISKLKKLITLELVNIHRLKAAHIVAICKHCSELYWIILRANKRLLLSVDNLLEMMENAEKLQHIQYLYEDEVELPEGDKMNIDADTYTKFVNIVKNRPESNKTFVEISSNVCNVNISDELIESHINYFELKISRS